METAARQVRGLPLEKKVALLSGRDIWSTHPLPECGIPAMYLSDGPHGVRKQLGRGDHLGLNESRPATCFPLACAAACSWDPELARQMGEAMGREAASLGVNVLLGPGLNIKRNPLGGRCFEYYSEDPYLSGKMAAGLIRGIQSAGVAACPKHFAVNSQELLRLCSDSVLDERTLRELYLTGFEIAIREGGPMAIMSSYNKINGVYANENGRLLTGILRDEWGFSGIVVTDWGGCNSQAAGIAAGSNLEMPGTYGDSDREVLAALRSGALSEEAVDRRAEELVRVIEAVRRDGPAPPFDAGAHHALARSIAAQSAVLLKNEGGLLPLPAGTRVAVVGDLARIPRYQGGGSSQVNPTRVDAPLDMLAESGLQITGFARGYRRDRKADPSLIAEAAELAAGADVVLAYLGLPEQFECEGADRAHMRLPENQWTLLSAVARANPNIAAVLCCGGAVELPGLAHCRALLNCYLSGQAGAGAAADVLTGRVNPSGKLAESWPLVCGDAPSAKYFPGRHRTAEYREGLYVGYRYYRSAGRPVRFPFGYGLSYTAFAYSDLTVGPDGVGFTLTNTGSRAGAETAQLYVSLPGGEVFRPAQELKGFVKLMLEPGEARRASIPFDDKTFRYFNVLTGRWEVEGGRYELLVGASAEDIRLRGALEVTGTDAPNPYRPEELPDYYSGQAAEVDEEQFAALLGRHVPESGWDPTAPLGWNDAFKQMRFARGPLARLIGLVLCRLEENSIRRGKPDLNLLFVCNMPFRALPKLTNGMISTEMAQSILTIANGRFFRGAGGLIFGLIAQRKRLKERRDFIK